MSYYSPNNIEDLEKLKKIIEQRKDIKKLRLNKKIKKETLNYDLAEQYAPIIKTQEKQTEVIKKGQEENTQAIKDQTLSLLTPAIKDDDDDVDSNNYTNSIQDEDEENRNIKSIDSEISDKVSALLNSDNTYSNFKFEKEDLNNYYINSKPFQIIDNKLIFNENEYIVFPYFYNIFLTRNTVNVKTFNDEEKEALINFVDYAGGLGEDKRSNLYKSIQKIKKENIQGSSVSFVFLSSNPNVLVERLEILVGESLAGNKNAFREASAILNELLQMNEISKEEYENGMNLFIS